MSKINPKKSWHPASKDNLEIVRRDQLAHQLSIDKNFHRQKQVESERRLNYLRSRHHQSTDAIDKNQHVNLFEEEERANLKGEGNKEYEEEKKMEKKKTEDIFTMYLDKGTKDVPWYVRQEADAPASRRDMKLEKQKKRDERWKELSDPMHMVHARYKPSKPTLSQSHQHQPTHFSSTSSSTSSSKSNGFKFDVEKLRQERLQRELDERKRLGQVPVAKTSSSAHYQTGFNPDVVERLKKRKEKYSDRYRPYDKY